MRTQDKEAGEIGESHPHVLLLGQEDGHRRCLQLADNRFRREE